MLSFRKKREKVFIFTTLDKVTEELNSLENNKLDIIIGLSNDDFKLNVLSFNKNLDEEKKEEEIESQLQFMITGYDPVDYITRTVTESVDEGEERVISISLEREQIEDLAQFAKENNFRLKGIYPSFLLDEQENLTDILMQLPSISVGEEVVTEDEVQDELDTGEERGNIFLLEHGEPLNLRKQIIDEVETKYNMLDQAQANEIHNSRMFDIIVKGLWVALVLVFVGFGALKVDEYMTSENLAETTAKNKQVEGKIKELESKIAAIPNFEMKLKKLQEIMNNKNPGANEVIFALRKSATKGVFVENIKMEGSKIELVGTAETTDGIYEFQRNLVKEGFFNISSSPLNNTGQFFTFKIEANIK